MNSCRSFFVQTFVLLVFLVADSDVNAELYRYLNEEGAVVIGSSVPPELTRNGYAIMSSDGSKVLKVVPRALTDEELAVHQREEEENRLLSAEREKQKEADDILRRLYSDPSDVIYARGVKLNEVDLQIKGVQTRLTKLEEQKLDFVAKAIEQERAGTSVSEELLKLMSAIDNRTVSVKREMEALNKEKVELIITYQKDYARVVQLYGAEKKDNISEDISQKSPVKVDPKPQ